MTLAPHLRMVVWPRKFQPHLSEKYNGIVNPAKFLQIYLADKCARAAEGHAWHNSPALKAGKDSKPNVGAAA
jgi:hypothetical protein